MMRLLFGSLLFCFSWLAQAADSSLSFTPPAGDYSVIFLGDLFGVVDGVLHGTGSQIMGNMFGVFNAAVLALGGIIITYTLMVSTMNTAHEGQMLGQKWSSIWIPVRSTMGLALLIPKASGYCLMQVFVMWIVLQGVGAADKIWNAALGYLSRGGVIIQAQTGTAETEAGAKTSKLNSAAQNILASQVCMLGLQKLLENKRADYLKQKQLKAGPFYQSGQTTAPVTRQQRLLNEFNSTPVPNFLETVNIVGKQSQQAQGAASPPTSFTIPLPNVTSGPYAKLNGICGSITWHTFDETQQGNINQMVSANDAQTAMMSIAIALQQMYQDLAAVAQEMVNNNPTFSPDPGSDQSNVSVVAKNPFGVPEQASGQSCDKPEDCTLWGSSDDGKAPLLNGTEFQGAISDFGAIMLPTLKLIEEAKNTAASTDSTGFIKEASQQGWIMAGSYFFDLAKLNQQHSGAWDQLAKQLDMGQGKGPVETSNVSLESSLTSPFTTQDAACNTKSDYESLCIWMQSDLDAVKDSLLGLIQGGVGSVSKVDPPFVSAKTSTPDKPQMGSAASTVYGYINNASLLQIPGQPTHTPPKILAGLPTPTFQWYQMPNMDFGCGWSITIIFWTICIGGPIASLLYNDIIKYVFELLLNTVIALMDTLFTDLIWIPLRGAILIFEHGMGILGQADINPVVALAQMGNFYINFAADTWMAIVGASIVVAIYPIIGPVIFVILGVTLPVVLSWLSLMVGIGFMVSFYVPLVPYLIFTFGAIAWLITVIEAMVAAPIVALGVSHPEGHDAFGKGEQAIMILMNVFLRPSMMIIGYIAAIALSYVGVWLLSTGYSNISDYLQISGPGGVNYTSWTAIFASFFVILIYTTTYIAIVQNSFSLISSLPDRVLRWIGGQPESIGQESSKWGEEVQSKVGEAGKSTMEGQSAGARKLAGYAGQAAAKQAKGQGGSVGASGGGG